MGGALRDVTKVTQCQIDAGCSNTARPGTALYKFPKDPVLRKQWERQVQRTGAKWTATESLVLCSISPLNVSKGVPLLRPSSV